MHPVERILQVKIGATGEGGWSMECRIRRSSHCGSSEDLAKALIANPVLQKMFQMLTSANRYSILYRIGRAKKAETRRRLIDQFVETLARGETIHPQS